MVVSDKEIVRRLRETIEFLEVESVGGVEYATTDPYARGLVQGRFQGLQEQGAVKFKMVVDDAV